MTITTRTGKGSALTTAELDGNFTDLNTNKAPLASPAFTGTPTGITKTHVGLANVDNTSDANKPVSTAQQTALNLKAPLASPAFTGTPTGITKAHVGLTNVDNTADASKPVSTAQQAAITAEASKTTPVTGTTYTVLASDNNAVLRTTSGSAVTITVNSTPYLTAGFSVLMAGAGAVSFNGTATLVGDSPALTVTDSTVAFLPTGTAGTYHVLSGTVGGGTYASLTDKASVDLSTVNLPLLAALDAIRADITALYAAVAAGGGGGTEVLMFEDGMSYALGGATAGTTEFNGRTPDIDNTEGNTWVLESGGAFMQESGNGVWLGGTSKTHYAISRKDFTFTLTIADLHGENGELSQGVLFLRRADDSNQFEIYFDGSGLDIRSRVGGTLSATLGVGGYTTSGPFTISAVMGTDDSLVMKINGTTVATSSSPMVGSTYNVGFYGGANGWRISHAKASHT